MLHTVLKRLSIFVALLCVAVGVSAQVYVGTLTVGNYTRQNVEARLSKKGDKVELLLKKVKFARMMPVTVDVTIADIQASASGQEVRLVADGVVPTAGDKSYERHLVRHFEGTASTTLNINCSMGDKQMHFEGVRKSQKNK